MIFKVLGMRSGLNSVSMAVGVMEKALYSSYTPEQTCPVVASAMGAPISIEINSAISSDRAL